MTIFSGVVAVLSPSLVSRCGLLPPARASGSTSPTQTHTNKQQPPPSTQLGAVLERMQRECGVACSRTAENVCLVQGEWDNIRRAHSYLLDQHNKAGACSSPPSNTDREGGPSPSSSVRTGEGEVLEQQRSPEPPVATSTPYHYSSAGGAPPTSPTHHTLPPARGARATGGHRKPGGAGKGQSESLMENIQRLRSEGGVTAMAAPTRSPGVGGGQHTPEPTSSSSSSSSSKLATQGRSGANKRKQGMPRKQLHNIGSSSRDVGPHICHTPPDYDEEEEEGMYDESCSPGGGRDRHCLQTGPKHKVQKTHHSSSPTSKFANGDSSLQIVATWGNFKEEETKDQKTVLTSGDEMDYTKDKLLYNQGGDIKTEKVCVRQTDGGGGLYTMQSDGQGGSALILPNVTEPVYVLNVTSDLSGNEEGLMDLTNKSQYHSSSSEREGGKWRDKSPNTKSVSPKKASSHSPRPTGRKQTSQRTLLLLSKKVTSQANQKVSPSPKKGKGLSPQRRRGIIQGDSPVKGEFTCSYCQKVFNTKEAIHVHEDVYHTGRYKSMPSSSKSPLFECTQCGKSYMSKHALEEHLYTHVGMRPFACPFCAASFNHRKSLRRHVQLHNNVKRFDCSKCCKTFVRKDALESHLRVHKTEEDVSSNDVN